MKAGGAQTSRQAVVCFSEQSQTLPLLIAASRDGVALPSSQKILPILTIHVKK